MKIIRNKKNFSENIHKITKLDRILKITSNFMIKITKMILLSKCLQMKIKVAQAQPNFKTIT